MYIWSVLKVDKKWRFEFVFVIFLSRFKVLYYILMNLVVVGKEKECEEKWGSYLGVGVDRGESK